MKYQIGFVPGQKIRVRDDLASWDEATNYSGGYFVTTEMLKLAGQTVTVADYNGWIIHIAELPNYAWIPDMFVQSLEDCAEQETESVSESVAFSIKSLCDAVKTLNDDDLELLCLEVEKEKLCRDSRKQRLLAVEIASAMDAYLQNVGDNRDFYTRGGEHMSMQDMYDAITSEFDLNAL